jgi:hypothetical protein
MNKRLIPILLMMALLAVPVAPSFARVAAANKRGGIHAFFPVSWRLKRSER